MIIPTSHLVSLLAAGFVLAACGGSVGIPGSGKEGKAPPIEAEPKAGIQSLLSGEFMEGVTAFIEKRSPRWKPE